jgi:hypothetical protein
MTLYVDADACPVKDEAERVATRLRVPMVLVSNGGIRPSANPLVESVYVGQGLDEADRPRPDGRPAQRRSVPTGRRAQLFQGRPLAVPGQS